MWLESEGIISLLTDKNPKICSIGLKKLEENIETNWSSVSDHIQILTNLANNNDFVDRSYAAILSSKVYYYLSKLSDALDFAILADKHFNPLDNTDEFSQVMCSTAIKRMCDMIKLGKEPPSNLKNIVFTVLNDLLQKKKFVEVVVLAVEIQNIEYVEKSLESCGSDKHDYDLTLIAFDIAYNHVDSVNFQKKMFSLIYKKLEARIERSFASDQFNIEDIVKVVTLHTYLNQSDDLASLLNRLSVSDEGYLIALQLCFVIAETTTQKFRKDLLSTIKDQLSDISPQKYETVSRVINRRIILEEYLNFSNSNYRFDLGLTKNLLKNIKCSKMLNFCGIMNSYTFSVLGSGADRFYRNNTKFLLIHRKWSKFNIYSSVGIVHYGNIESPLELLRDPLQKVDERCDYVTGGGALYSLGLISANYCWNEDVVRRFKALNLKAHIDSFDKDNSNILLMGWSLGVGLTMIGTHDAHFSEKLMLLIEKDQPDVSDSAVYGYGMVNLANADLDKIFITKLFDHASTTEHEKVSRAISLGLALILYGSGENSEDLIKNCLESTVARVREGAAWITAFAYVGTGSALALNRLLHLAISDTDHHVRRASVIGVAFVLSKNPEKVPEMINLLMGSFSPFVRAGAALAIGISRAGTGDERSIEMLKPLLEDIEDHVQQSALMAMAMVLQQQSDVSAPYVKTFRNHLRKHHLPDDKHPEILSFGVCLAYGILNLSGRSAIVSLNTLNGHRSMVAAAGFALFCHFFYFHPLVHMLSLAVQRTAVIALCVDQKNYTLSRVQDLSIYCNMDPSLYMDTPLFENEFTPKEIKPAKLSLKPKQKATEEETEVVKYEEIKAKDPLQSLKNPIKLCLNQKPNLLIDENSLYEPVFSKYDYGLVIVKEKSKDDDNFDFID